MLFVFPEVLNDKYRYKKMPSDTRLITGHVETIP